MTGMCPLRLLQGSLNRVVSRLKIFLGGFGDTSTVDEAKSEFEQACSDLIDDIKLHQESY